MSVVTALLVLVRQTVCYITRGAQSPDGLSWWLEEVGMVVREDTSLPCQVTRLHWEPRVSVCSSDQWTVSPTLETECYVVSGLCGNW